MDNSKIENQIQPNRFDFEKAEHLALDIYNLVVVLDGYCKNQCNQYSELDCISTTVEYLRKNSAKLSCMFEDYRNNENEENL